MMGAGKVGQLGVGRAMETCTEPKMLELPSGMTVKKVCRALFILCCSGGPV